MAVLSSEQNDEIFLQGDYLSVGVGKSGSLGTRGAAPAGNATDAGLGFLRVGLLADTDGFGRGKATPLHDAILRGIAVEGFNIGYKVAGTTYVRSNQDLDGLNQISGKASEASTATVGEADWKGATTEKLGIDQKITLTEDAKYLRFDVVLTNNSASAMADLRYMRTVDPDHGATFTTNNEIVKQGAGEALVAAYASGSSSPLFLYADDPRAVVSVYGFINQNPYAAAAYDAPQKQGYKVNADQTVNIDFGLGTLGAGQSTTVTFYLGVTDNLAATVAAIKAQEDGSPPPPPPPPPVNDAPHAVADSLSIAAGATGKGNVLANDTDADGDKLTASLKAGPAHGTLKLSADGSYSYVADAGFSGIDSFTYAASDGKASSSAAVAITVAGAVDRAPVTKGDLATVIAGASVTGNVLANDTDPDGDALSASLKTGPAHGTLKLAADGSYTYAADRGFAGVDTFYYYASDGEKTVSEKVAITVTPPANVAPVAIGDTATVIAGASVTGNVLTNDIDANGDALTASLKTGPAHGTLTLAVDGSYTYKADANYAGADSFTYTASDGKAAGNATVAITVSPSQPLPGLPDSPLLQRAGTLNGSAVTNDTLTGVAHHNSFYFDLAAKTGADTITNFGKDDILVTKGLLYDGNRDGIIAYQKAKMALDTPKSSDDVLTTSGLSSVRYLGTDSHGLSVYADASVRPKGAIESKISDDTLTGDSADKAKNVFFFDSALDISLGHDTINKFGAKDLLVTTSALSDANGDHLIDLGASGTVKLIGGSGALDDALTPGEAGTIDLNDLGNGAVQALEFDGSTVHGGVTYYVYSLVGSSAGAAQLVF